MSAAPISMCLMLLLDHTEQATVLGRKLRGFGEGKIVAPGGKVGSAESSADAARRELTEETGLIADQAATRPAGILNFSWSNPETAPLTVWLYSATRWTGQLRNSDELDTFWCPMDSLPYAQMWDDSRLWLPPVLRGATVHATMHYDAAGVYVRQCSMQIDP